MLTLREEKTYFWIVTMVGQDDAAQIVGNLWEGEGMNVSGWTVYKALKQVGSLS